MEFTSLMRRVAADLAADAAAIDAVPVEIKFWPPEGAAIGAAPAPAAAPARTDKRKPDPQPKPPRRSSPQSRKRRKISVAETLSAIAVNHDDYQTVLDKDGLERWVARIYEEGHVALDIETTADRSDAGELAGIALGVAPGEACYIPVGHRTGDGLDFGGSEIKQLPLADLITLLKPVLEDPAILKIGQNLKYDALVFRRRGIEVARSRTRCSCPMRSKAG